MSLFKKKKLIYDRYREKTCVVYYVFCWFLFERKSHIFAYCSKLSIYFFQTSSMHNI